MRMSERSVLSALSSAVMNAITRKILNSSLAATRLAENTPPSAETGLPVRAKTTRAVPTMEGTTTLARRIIVSTMTATPDR
ncbi:hypothetical protein D3C72_2131110 [compost metagenome]